MYCPSSILSGSAPAEVGTIEAHTRRESLSSVAGTLPSWLKVHVSEGCEEAERCESLAMDASAINPAPSTVRLDEHPIAVPRGVTLSKLTTAARTCGKRR